jgi:glycosyltransferase involved in cell wall biosynthesis
MTTTSMAVNLIRPILSICIATYNRGRFIGATLESILAQADDNVEIIVVDGASPDNTQEVIEPYLSQHPNLHYYRENTNSGVDCDYDKSVGYATGEYCWLMPDDDLLAPDAISRLLKFIDKSYDLIVVNSEVWNADFSTSLDTRMLKLREDKTYDVGDGEKVFVELATCLSFIGSVVIKRSVWLKKDRSSYYGTLYVHIGVIFQHPSIESIAVIADPMIHIRYGNSMWSPRSFEVLYFKWPQLIWSFPQFSAKSKQNIIWREPWRRLRSLFKSRAIGEYSHSEYRKYLSGHPFDIHIVLAYMICVFPAKVANMLWVLYYAIFQRSALFTLFDLLRSPHSSVISRSIARFLRIEVV